MPDPTDPATAGETTMTITANEAKATADAVNAALPNDASVRQLVLLLLGRIKKEIRQGGYDTELQVLVHQYVNTWGIAVCEADRKRCNQEKDALIEGVRAFFDRLGYAVKVHQGWDEDANEPYAEFVLNWEAAHAPH